MLVARSDCVQATTPTSDESGPGALFHTLTAEQALQRLKTSRDGLSESEAAARLARDGRNELPPPKRTSWLLILLRQFISPLIAVLVVAAIVSVALGEPDGAAFIGGVVVFNALIGFLQEVRSEREIIRLFTLMRATARVERDDELREIDAADLVVGDIVWLEDGARVPADLRVIREHNVAVDESPLTGESTSVSKHVKPIDDTGAIPAERRNMLFAGTGLTRGRATGVVTATGARTELGETARELETTRRGKPPLVIRIERLSRLLATATVVGCALVFALGVARGIGIGEMFLVSVALAVAAIPEGLPVAITLALAVGLRRMARRGVLVRRLEAVEGLGSCTVICTDKTGTLTLNQLTVTRIATQGGSYAVSGAGYNLEGEVEGKEDAAVEALLISACFANEASLAINTQAVVSGDPTDIALLIAAHKRGIKHEHLLEQSEEVASLPFESERQFAASFIRSKDGVRVHVKGAPERVLAMCEHAMGLDGSTAALDADGVQNSCDELTSQGLRVLAVACGAAPDGVADDVPERPNDLTFLGLIAMRDAPRPEAAEAVKACHDGGVRVVLATGDHARTALAVATELGIVEPGAKAVTGREIEKMDDAQFDVVAREVDVFARVTPHEKLRLVQALQKQGELVAMTGDGANDAGALKTAHIGVAMGKRGTDVAKDAARVVITDDNFASIVAGIEEGRIVHDNVRNVVALLVMTGVGEVLAILVCILIGLPIPFTPVQLLWVNLVTGGLQTVSLPLEPGEPGILKRPPRPPAERIFDRLMLTRTAIVASVIAATIVGAFGWLLHLGYSAFEASNVAVLLVVLIENIHLGNCRSERRSALLNSPLRNPWVLWAVLVAQGVHIAAMHWGPTQKLLNLEPVSIEMWGLMLAVSLSVLAAVEVHKLIERRAGVATARAQLT